MIAKYFSKGDKMIFDGEQTIDQKEGKTFANVTVKNVYLELCKTKGKQQSNDFEGNQNNDIPF